MPFWKPSTSNDQQKEAQARQDLETSLRSLEIGGLPVQARRRLQEETAAGHPLFTSDLSANEFLLTRPPDYTPLGQVMGSVIYHVGANSVFQGMICSQGYIIPSELEVLSQAHQQAAKLALGRLEQEAALLHAHGVIGVRFTRKHYAWEPDIVEYVAIGTAIRLGNEPPPQRPFLSDLSGQEFWTVLQAGYYPAGLVTGFCSYVAVVPFIDRWDSVSFNAYYNKEITPFSLAIRTARERGMQRLIKSARGAKAQGVVGMHIEIEREIEKESSRRELKLLVHFSAVGTAITSRTTTQTLPKPVAALTFTDLRPGRLGETQLLTARL